MSDCPKCRRPFNDGNSPNESECNGTDDDEGVCQAYAKIAVLRARVASLKAALRDIAAPTRVYDEYDEEHSCAECGAYTMLGDGLEPAPECHPCSSSLLKKARSIARAAIAKATGGAK